jgi:hypothetical protein
LESGEEEEEEEEEALKTGDFIEERETREKSVNDKVS